MKIVQTWIVSFFKFKPKKKSQERHEQLHHDCSSFKKSNLGQSHLRSGHTHILQLMDTSPRMLVRSFQQQKCPPNGWKVRITDLAAEEIVRERRAAIVSGRVKGRRLFDASSEGATELGLHGSDEDVCSACSSVFIRGSEVRSLWCDTSSVDDDGPDHDDGDGLSFSSSLCTEHMEGEKMVGVGEKGDSGVVFAGCTSGDGGKWMVMMGWVVLVLMVCAWGVITWMSFDGWEDGEMLIPT